MNAYETTATVEEYGQIHIAGLPFSPGTEVAITVREKVSDEFALEQARIRMRELFARIRSRNTESVGPLRREELYDRKVLR